MCDKDCGEPWLPVFLPPENIHSFPADVSNVRGGEEMTDRRNLVTGFVVILLGSFILIMIMSW
jgi:hypothetical protein